MITLTPCTSQVLQAHGYDAATQILAIRFGGDKIYHYQNVPADVYAKMCEADSVGTAFAKLIRGQYPHEVVLDESDTLEPSDT